MTRFYNPAGAFEGNDCLRFDMIGDPEHRYTWRDLEWIMDSDMVFFIGRKDDIGSQGYTPGAGSIGGTAVVKIT